MIHVYPNCRCPWCLSPEPQGRGVDSRVFGQNPSAERFRSPWGDQARKRREPIMIRQRRSRKTWVKHQWIYEASVFYISKRKKKTTLQSPRPWRIAVLTVHPIPEPNWSLTAVAGMAFCSHCLTSCGKLLRLHWAAQIWNILFGMLLNTS